MGRIFETRKHVMFKRWDKMAKACTRIGGCRNFKPRFHRASR
jgi:hypothetical protein